MTITPINEHLLSEADIEVAEDIAASMRDVEGQMINICYLVAKACNEREDGFIQPFLARALPSLKATTRRDVLQAGRERQLILSASRRNPVAAEYGWTTLASIHSLPESHKDWAYEEKRTRQEIRDYKRSLKPIQPKTEPKPLERADNQACPIRVAKVMAEAKELQKVSAQEWVELRENQPNQKTHVLNDEEYAVFLEAVDSAREWQALATELAAEVERLNQIQSTQSTNDLNPVLELASRLSDYGSGSRPELDESIPPPIDFNWHKGIPLDSKERKDANQIGKLIDAIGLIQKEYAFTGIWGPHEWTSILAGLNRLTACASAQRRFKPGSQPGPVIDIG